MCVGHSLHADEHGEIQFWSWLPALPQDWQPAPGSDQPHGPQRYLHVFIIVISQKYVTLQAVIVELWDNHCRFLNCLSQSCWSWGTPWFITFTTVWRKWRRRAAWLDFLTSWLTDKPASIVLSAETALYMRGTFFSVITSISDKPSSQNNTVYSACVKNLEEEQIVMLRSSPSLVVSLPSRAVDGSSAGSSEGVVQDFLQQEMGHLTPPHLTYFSHWLLLCCLEATTMEAKNGRKRVWLQTVEER